MKCSSTKSLKFKNVEITRLTNCKCPTCGALLPKGIKIKGIKSRYTTVMGDINNGLESVDDVLDVMQEIQEMLIDKN